MGRNVTEHKQLRGAYLFSKLFMFLTGRDGVTFLVANISIYYSQI